jgi:hypothetical protein
MLIKAQDLKDIQENKVTLVKNFASLTREYDFNLISNLMEENYLSASPKTTFGNLGDIFHIYKVSNCLQEFKTFFDFLTKLCKYERHLKDEVDLFFSLVSQVGNTHVDNSDVFIIGLKGKTIYKVFDFENKDYTVEKGDMIFIPKNIKHKAVGINPRIIASIGFYGKKNIK